jgi:hypothetical protein
MNKFMDLILERVLSCLSRPAERSKLTDWTGKSASIILLPLAPKSLKLSWSNYLKTISYFLQERYAVICLVLELVVSKVISEAIRIMMSIFVAHDLRSVGDQPLKANEETH